MLVLALFASQLPAGASDDHPFHLQIFNGEPAAISEVPSVVYIESPVASCTGTVVAAHWVLTAAHCFDGAVDPATILVASGSDSFAAYQAGFGQVIEAARYVVHPDFDPTTVEADVALIELSTATDAPAQLLASAGAASPVGETATITGWGLVSNNPPVETEVLRRALAPVLEDEVCAQLYGPDYLATTSVCAGGQGQDVCQGDSGGPLLVDSGSGGFVQWGVVTYGEPCDAQSQTIGVYTSIASYRTWNDAQIGGDTDPIGDFPDVPSTSAHAAAIAAVTQAGIAGGFPDGTFRPDAPVTRGQMSTFLARALDLDLEVAPDPGYADVPADSSHAAAIAAVTEAGIAGGFPDGTFRPRAPVTRAQLATFLAGALDLDLEAADPDGTPVTDVPADDAHADAISVVIAEDIASGFPDGTFRPRADVTRGQMATFLTRAFGLG